MLKKITSENYIVSKWAGGTTTQLAIYPPEALYSDRDFLWRISSASVDTQESEFTLLEDYDRLISTIEGSVKLNHNDGPVVNLKPYQVHSFDGADKTVSRGTCTDFNLIMKKGRVKGEMLSAIAENSEMPFAIELKGGETLLIYMVGGRGTVYAANQQPIGMMASETVVFTQAWDSLVRFNLNAGAKAFAVIVEVLPEK